VTPEPPITVYVTAGNRGLAQGRWAAYITAVVDILESAGARVHAELFSTPLAQWQTACWCIELQPGIAERLKSQLAAIVFEYGQDAIGWAEAPATEFVR